MACITRKKSKKGRWCIDFYDQNGKRRLKVLPKGATKADARKKLREIESLVDSRVFIPKKNIPVFSDVTASWLEQKKPNLRDSTWSVYEGHTKNHFNDLENVKINQISTATVERFITSRQNDGMNISTLRKILVTLNQIFSYAVRHKLIDHNPLRDAERPRDKGDQEEKEITVLSPSEINQFLNAVKIQKYQVLFRLAVMSGARQGELLGLKWSDIDWINSQIHIQRTFNNSAWYNVKTKTSNRRIDIGPSMMAQLKMWQRVCPETELDLVFPNGAGQPINHNNLVNRYYRPALKAAKLPIIRFHDLRHTYASLLIEQGENIKYIQSQLGHSTPTVTLNVYAHLMKPVNQEAACRLENMVFETNGDQMETKTKKEVMA